MNLRDGLKESYQTNCKSYTITPYYLFQFKCFESIKAYLIYISRAGIYLSIISTDGFWGNSKTVTLFLNWLIFVRFYLKEKAICGDSLTSKYLTIGSTKLAC